MINDSKIEKQKNPCKLVLKKGDIFNALEEDGNIIICHQVNCKGVMGAGLAQQIRIRFPIVFEKYKDTCCNSFPLGSAELVEIGKSKYVCNLYGQNGYGTDKRYTDYIAFEQALHDLHDQVLKMDSCTVCFPYMIGCGLAGGLWPVVLELIERYFPNAHIYKL